MQSWRIGWVCVGGCWTRAWYFAVTQSCFVRWPFTILVPRGHTAPHGRPMPNVPSDPLLFVIGLPNVAALHWRGCWQTGSNLNQVLI